jgi:hypothetical protein
MCFRRRAYWQSRSNPAETWSPRGRNRVRPIARKLAGLILAGAPIRLAEALKLFSGGSAPEKKSDYPIEIIGRLVLEQASDATGDKAQTGGMAWQRSQPGYDRRRSL